MWLPRFTSQSLSLLTVVTQRRGCPILQYSASCMALSVGHSYCSIGNSSVDILSTLDGQAILVFQSRSSLDCHFGIAEKEKNAVFWVLDGKPLPSLSTSEPKDCCRHLWHVAVPGASVTGYWLHKLNSLINWGKGKELKKQPLAGSSPWSPGWTILQSETHSRIGSNLFQLSSHV